MRDIDGPTHISAGSVVLAVFIDGAPVPALKALTIGCAVFAAYGAPQLANGKCLSFHILGAPPVFATWWPTWPKC